RRAASRTWPDSLGTRPDPEGEGPQGGLDLAQVGAPGDDGPAALHLDAALQKAASEEGRWTGDRIGAGQAVGAEFDPAFGIGAVEPLVELAGAVAADQRP